MTKQKIKIFLDSNLLKVEEKINKWIENENVYIVDIKSLDDPKHFIFYVNYVEAFKNELLTEKIKNDKI